MASSNRVAVEDLGKALAGILDEYGTDVLEKVDAASLRAVERLADITRDTAPVGYRKKFRRSIAVQEVSKSSGKFAGRTYAWYVKPPDHRLTHLLVHGHDTKDGGRTAADPFLHNAVEQVVPEYIKEVEEALKW